MEPDQCSTLEVENRPPSGLRRKLYIIIFEAETKAGKWFDLLLLVLILLSTIEIVLESDSVLFSKVAHLFFYIEWGFTVFFTIEYAVRLWVSRKPLNYAKSFFGIIDLLAILPTYIALFIPSTQYLKVIRVFRLLRIFRILKLSQFVDASQSLGSALWAGRYKIFIFFEVITAIVLIMGSLMHIAEQGQPGFSSIPKSMYWAIVTMTTVGYGDIVPVTAAGKFIASLMMLTGYAIIAVPTGIVTNELNNASQKPTKPCKRCKEPLRQNANYCHKCGEATDEHS